MQSVATWYRKAFQIGHRQVLTGTLRGSQRDPLGDVIASRTSPLRGMVKPRQRDLEMANLTGRRPKS